MALAVTAEAPTKNVYQRKLAVMAKCDDIKLDKVHPHHGFRYISIQNIEERLRKLCVEEGLDITATCFTTTNHITIVLTNVDDPKDQIESTWPLADDDKGFAYSVKYPLLRIFHVGDEEEARETREQPARGTQAAPVTFVQRGPTDRQAKAPASGKGSHCVFCEEMGYLSSTGLVPTLWVASKGPMAGQLQCNGRTPDGGYANHPAPVTAEEVAAAENADDIAF
jgi:hypothetical protein